VIGDNIAGYQNSAHLVRIILCHHGYSRLYLKICTSAKAAVAESHWIGFCHSGTSRTCHNFSQSIDVRYRATGTTTDVSEAEHVQQQRLDKFAGASVAPR
jgi:hypothetical protein